MVITPALAAMVAALRDILQEAATLALQANAALAVEKRNLAIGTLLSLEEKLPTASALLKATLALHRSALDRHKLDKLTPEFHP